MKILAVLVFLSGLIFSPTVSAQTLQACGPTDAMFASLAQRFQETQVGWGPALMGGLVTLLTSEHGETWSLVLSMPNGLSCMIAAGEGWRKSPWVDPAENRI